jgi:hypothetical protein
VDAQFRMAVFDEAKLPELVHKMADPRSRGAHHLRQSFLAQPGNCRVELILVVDVRQPHQRPSQPLLAIVEQLIHQVLLGSDAPPEKVLPEQFRKPRGLMQDPQHGRFLNPHQRAVCERDSRRQSQRQSSQAFLAKEVSRFQNGLRDLFPFLRYHRELYPAALDVKHRCCRIPLREDDAVRPVFDSCPGLKHFTQNAVPASGFSFLAFQNHCGLFIEGQPLLRHNNHVAHDYLRLLRSASLGICFCECS